MSLPRDTAYIRDTLVVVTEGRVQDMYIRQVSRYVGVEAWIRSGRLGAVGWLLDTTMPARTAWMEVRIKTLEKIIRERQWTVTEYKTRTIDYAARWFSGIMLLLIVGYVFLRR